MEPSRWTDSAYVGICVRPRASGRSTNFLRKALLALGWLALIAPAQAKENWEAPVDCSAEHKNLPSFEHLARTFQYDIKTPLDLNVLGTAKANGVNVESIDFAGTNGERCSAAIVVPKRGGQLPAVVWLGSGDKDWQPYAMDFSKLGAISFLLDDCGKGSVNDAKEFREDEIQDVINIRRAVDILFARPDVDRGRIAFVGHSGGAMLGAVAVAVDKRFKAAVFESGLQGFTYHICTSQHPFAAGIRKQLDGKLKEYASALASLDSILYIGHSAPTALLFQSARLDKGVPQSDAQAFFDAASEPKELLWYDTGHEMTLSDVSRDRTTFLKAQLGMRS
jgi:uncharacterized protein